MEDLWPDDIGKTTERAPVSILRQQAQFFRNRFQGELSAEVNSLDYTLLLASEEMKKLPKPFIFEFVLVAPQLKNYRFRLFSLGNGYSLYPCSIYFREGDRDPLWEAPDEESLLAILRHIFTAKMTQQVISSVRAQMR